MSDKSHPHFYAKITTLFVLIFTDDVINNGGNPFLKIDYFIQLFVIGTGNP